MKTAGIQLNSSKLKLFKKVDPQFLTIEKIEQYKIYSWNVKSVKHTIEFIYASFFDGQNSFKIQTPELNHFRKEFYPTSISNPIVFAQFYGLAKPNIECQFPNFVSNSLIKEPIVIQWCESLTYTCPVLGNLKDLEFSINQTFFKINKIEIEKIVEKDFKSLLLDQKINIKEEKIFIDRFFVLSGFKFLFSNSLKNLCTDLIVTLSPVFGILMKEKNNDIEVASPEFQPESLRKGSTRAANTLYSSVDVNGVYEMDFQLRNKKNVNKKNYVAALVISKPQINVYDDCTETQVLFGSSGNSVLLISNNYLEYDIFQQDPKYDIDFHFNNLELYTGKIKSTFTSRLAKKMFLGG